MIKRIVLATSNRDKVKEIKAIIGDIVIPWWEITKSVPDVDEDTDTFVGNAKKKACTIAKALNMPALADDSGLVVDAINGAPGVYSSRFAGENATYADNNKKLLDALKDVPTEKRTARFVCVAALCLPDGKVYITKGTIEGKITLAPRGTNGFGYDPIFELPNGYTTAQLSADEKNAVSHRSEAMRKMVLIIERMGAALWR